MAHAQKNMVPRPLTMVMGVAGMAVNMIVRVVVMNRHGATLTQRHAEFTHYGDYIGPVGSLPGALQTKFLASLMSPLPL